MSASMRVQTQHEQPTGIKCAPLSTYLEKLKIVSIIEWAILNNSWKYLDEILLDADGYVYALNYQEVSSGYAPIHFAIIKKSVSIVKSIHSRGGDISVRDKLGQDQIKFTVMTFGSGAIPKEIIDYLIQVEPWPGFWNNTISEFNLTPRRRVE